LIYTHQRYYKENKTVGGCKKYFGEKGVICCGLYIKITLSRVEQFLQLSELFYSDYLRSQ